MILLGRFIRFMARSILNLILSLLVILFRFILLPLLLTIFRIARNLVFMSFTAMVQGPRQYTNRIASDWARRLLEMGIQRENIDQAYSLCQFLVFSMITLGLFISALFTALIIRVVFGFFT